jgi:heme O synthase-like polyprenyltransferase
MSVASDGAHITGRMRAGAAHAPYEPSIARRLFAYSILYLFLLFAVLLIENRLSIIWGGGLA